MKKLLVLMAVVILSTASLGCRCTNPFARGPSCPSCGQAGMAGYGGDGFGAGGPGMMGPETYMVPGPQ